MRLYSLFLLSSSLSFSLFCQSNEGNFRSETAEKKETFEPFTGKINKNRVRLRLQGNYEAPVLKELNQNDYIVVLGEEDDFYSIQPPNETKGYVFHAYVIDQVIEGDRVNIRSKPNREAQVIAQLKTGDRIQKISTIQNNKWIEIKLPSNIRFYIAKEYVDKAGDIKLKERLEKKRQAAVQLLNTTDEMSLVEMQKPYNQMNIAGIKANYQHLINDYAEFNDISAQAKDSLAAIQESFNSKKLAYFEAETSKSSQTVEINKKLNSELQKHKDKISELETKIQDKNMAVAERAEMAKNSSLLPVNMAKWLPVEENLFNKWAEKSGKTHPQDFYLEEREKGFTIQGVIDPYTREVKNKPGDYVLLSANSKLPMAFLYSTHINLQDYIGREVKILVSPRENYHFAFPAYFVLSIISK